jgi:hypothetical protein
LLSILVSFSADGDAAVEFERAASELVDSAATMVLSEARGLWLFLVIREGIGCKWVTRCRGTQGRTVLTDTPLEPSISRTRPTTTGENPRVESLLSPEMLKLLADATVWGRNLLLSSTWLK